MGHVHVDDGEHDTAWRFSAFFHAPRRKAARNSDGAAKKKRDATRIMTTRWVSRRGRKEARCVHASICTSIAHTCSSVHVCLPVVDNDCRSDGVATETGRACPRRRARKNTPTGAHPRERKCANRDNKLHLPLPCPPLGLRGVVHADDYAPRDKTFALRIRFCGGLVQVGCDRLFSSWVSPLGVFMSSGFSCLFRQLVEYTREGGSLFVEIIEEHCKNLIAGLFHDCQVELFTEGSPVA